MTELAMAGNAPSATHRSGGPGEESRPRGSFPTQPAGSRRRRPRAERSEACRWIRRSRPLVRIVGSQEPQYLAALRCFRGSRTPRGERECSDRPAPGDRTSPERTAPNPQKVQGTRWNQRLSPFPMTERRTAKTAGLGRRRSENRDRHGWSAFHVELHKASRTDRRKPRARWKITRRLLREWRRDFAETGW
jgi:hypothetical protein